MVQVGHYEYFPLPHSHVHWHYLYTAFMRHLFITDTVVCFWSIAHWLLFQYKYPPEYQLYAHSSLDCLSYFLLIETEFYSTVHMGINSLCGSGWSPIPGNHLHLALQMLRLFSVSQNKKMNFNLRGKLLNCSLLSLLCALTLSLPTSLCWCVCARELHKLSYVYIILTGHLTGGFCLFGCLFGCWLVSWLVFSSCIPGLTSWCQSWWPEHLSQNHPIGLDFHFHD